MQNHMPDQLIQRENVVPRDPTLRLLIYISLEYLEDDRVDKPQLRTSLVTLPAPKAQTYTSPPSPPPPPQELENRRTLLESCVDVV